MDLRTRPKESYSSEALKEINLLSFTEQGAVPFGSSVYVIQKYPGDIDTYEHVITKGPIKTACKRIAAEMQDVVLRIVSTPNHWVTDIKAGIDKDWDLSLGDLYRGNWTPNMENLKWIIDHVSPEDAAKIVSILSTLPILDWSRENNYDSGKYDQIDKIVREYKIIRWTPAELVNGRIKKNGKTVSLTNALCGNSQVKIDSVSIIDGKFVETTNMLYLGYVENGTVNPINTSYNFLDPVAISLQYDESLRREIEKLFYSDVWYSPFKGAKRMWAFSRVKYLGSEDRQSKKDLEVLTPLISGNVSLLYQIKSEAGTIELIPTRLTSKKWQEVTDRWKVAISHVAELKNDQMLELLNLISSNTSIGKIQEALKVVIADMTISYLQRHNLLPLPARFLPEVPRYTALLPVSYP